MGKLTTFWERQKEKRDMPRARSNFLLLFQGFGVFSAITIECYSRKKVSSHTKARQKVRWGKWSNLWSIWNRKSPHNAAMKVTQVRWLCSSADFYSRGRLVRPPAHNTLHRALQSCNCNLWRKCLANALRWIPLCFEFANSATQFITQHAILQACMYVLHQWV